MEILVHKFLQRKSKKIKWIKNKIFVHVLFLLTRLSKKQKKKLGFYCERFCFFNKQLKTGGLNVWVAWFKKRETSSTSMVPSLQKNKSLVTKLPADKELKLGAKWVLRRSQSWSPIQPSQTQDYQLAHKRCEHY